MDKIVEVQFYKQDRLIKIYATMKKCTFSDEWECDQIHGMYWDGCIFDFDEHPHLLKSCEKIIIEESAFDAVNDMFQDDDYTEDSPSKSWQELAALDAGVSESDFYWPK